MEYPKVLDFFTRYEDRIMPEPNSGCWIWLGAQISAGYGHGYFDGQHFYAHREAFKAENGPDSLDGLICRHRCDFPPCCNPDHLLAGDHADNRDDMVRRGRANFAKGERSAKAILFEEDVRLIRLLGSEGFTVNQITELFPVKRNAITAILDGQNWKCVGAGVQWMRERTEPPHYCGEQSATSLLTEKQVLSIRRRLAEGERGTALAREHNVSPCTISAIKKRRIWSHLEEDQK